MKNLRLVLLFTVLGLLAQLLILPYEMQATPQVFTAKGTAFGITVLLVQVIITVLIQSSIGLWAASKVKLDVPILRSWLYGGEKKKFDRKTIFQAILFGIIPSIFVLALEKYVFLPNLSALTQGVPHISWWKGLLASFYGGIIEEVMVRLFVMSIVVWLLSLLFSRGKERPQNWIYWVGIFAAALVFGIGHLPAAKAIFGNLTPLLVVRELMGNGLVGIACGYLYWKRGLEYAMIAHLSSDLVVHVLTAI